MIEVKSAPAASSAARSITCPPEACGRASRVTRTRISSSSIAPRLCGHGRVALALLAGHLADLQRAFLDLALDILQFQPTPLSCTICLGDHGLRLARRRARAVPFTLGDRRGEPVAR